MKTGQTATACSPRWSQRSQAMWKPMRRPIPPLSANQSFIKVWRVGQACDTKTPGSAFMQAPTIAQRPTRASSSSSSSPFMSAPRPGQSSSSSSSSNAGWPPTSLSWGCGLPSLIAFSLCRDFRISWMARSQMLVTCAGCRQPAPALRTTEATPFAIGPMSSGSSARARSAPTLSTNCCTSSTPRACASWPFVVTVFEATCTSPAQQG
mmetsp:Transcript_7735/g.22907  ORF Transcript_7735/g.22907 Transcript_7735/m.22907 type:complete len:208 (-) Transcript_7735:838-1461(-)